MFVFLICTLTLWQVRSACIVVNICTENPAVQAEIVNIHNAYRREVQPTASDMLKMSYSDEVAANAKTWIEKCILAHGKPETRMINGYETGENLFYSSTPAPWSAVIGAWHREVSNYQFPFSSTNNRSIGHYTQVVWNSSYKVGCAMTLCPNNIYLYGCHYYRAGNFRRWPPYKVGPWCGSCPDNCDDRLCTNPCPYINRYINCPHLKAIFGCGHNLVKTKCVASCECTDEIIPIY
ncbi:cysteine-rich venom protein [Plectropomus leopardus]|uniref:cysteine-rich venom protein n=1 Tax=Plectropomus leopardus TaxID=160734 RepID=UPI001C4BCD70|nr:cysteine-rich venom protein [Plectropomus leopardus]